MISDFFSQFSFDTLVIVAQGSATVVAVVAVSYLIYKAWRLF